MALRQKSALKSAVVPATKTSSVDNPGALRDGRNRASGKGRDSSKVTRSSKTDFGKSPSKRSANPPICLVDPEILNTADVTGNNTATENAIDTDKVTALSEFTPVPRSRTAHALKSVKHCIVESATEPSSSAQDQNMIQRVESAIQGLGKLESDVMAALFPTDGSLPQSNEVIAARLGMTVEEVKGISDNALRGLRGARGPGGRPSSAWN